MGEYVSDDELAAALERHEIGAEEAFSARFRRPLQQFAMSKGFTLDDAEDLAQQTLIEGWDNIRSFRRGQRLDRWLSGIEYNLMRREWERRKRLPSDSLEALTSKGMDIASSAEAAGDPETSLGLAQFWAKYQVYALLLETGSKKKYVSAVQLRYIDGLSDKEIAAALGLGSEGSARVYVQRGLRALREMDENNEG
jgi:RNA polymerase sigma factor (sigma-70 family)